MVRLSAQQEAHIPKLQAARAVLDRTITEAEAELRVRRQVAREQVAAVVWEALEAGVPARQVAIRGLGYADVGSLKQFAGSDGTIAQQTAQAVAEPVHVPVTVKFEEGAEDEYIEFTGGNDEKHSYVGFTDHPELDFVRIDADWTKKLPNRDEIREAVGAALSEKYGKPVFWYD